VEKKQNATVDKHKLPGDRLQVVEEVPKTATERFCEVEANIKQIEEDFMPEYYKDIDIVYKAYRELEQAHVAHAQAVTGVEMRVDGLEADHGKHKQLLDDLSVRIANKGLKVIDEGRKRKEMYETLSKENEELKARVATLEAMVDGLLAKDIHNEAVLKDIGVVLKYMMGIM
jgi:BMFP domain-containing protein YqiC